MSRERFHSPYPRLEKLSAREERESNRILGITPEPVNLFENKVNDLRSLRRKAKWYQRRDMVKEEVLDASDATAAEREFLLGNGKIDPSPLVSITYDELEPSDEIIDLTKRKPEVKTITQSPKPEELGSTKLADRIRIFLGISEERNAAIISGLYKRAIFSTRVQMAVATALALASDATIAESEFLLDVRGFDKEKLPDPKPEHQIKYRRLVAVKTNDSEPVSSEATA